MAVFCRQIHALVGFFGARKEILLTSFCKQGGKIVSNFKNDIVFKGGALSIQLF
jgi:hypothetical protein